MAGVRASETSGRGDWGGCGDRSGRWGCEVPLIEFGEELVLSVGDGLGAERRDLGGRLSFANGGLGLGGEEGAVALGVCIALSDSGGDAGGAGVCWDGSLAMGVTELREVPGAAGAMGGETFGHLFL